MSTSFYKKFKKKVLNGEKARLSLPGTTMVWALKMEPWEPLRNLIKTITLRDGRLEAYVLFHYCPVINRINTAGYQALFVEFYYSQS